MKNRLRSMLPPSLMTITAGVGLFFFTGNVAVANPYEPIVSRNVFALKPPTLLVTTPPEVSSPPPGVELRGISTLFGKSQVLLTLKIPAKPPEPAVERSVILDVGQREGDVEVLEINPIQGSIRLRVQGKESDLNLKDNAVKATASATPAATPTVFPKSPSGGATPSVPPLSNISGSTSVNSSQISSVPTTGGAMPSRSLRSSGGGVQPQKQRELSAEEGAALLEINRKANEGKGLPFPPPRFKVD